MSSGHNVSGVRALVAGAGGFLGTRLVARLGQAGGRVVATGLHLQPHEASGENGSRVSYVPLDILQRKRLERVLGDFATEQGGPIQVFHMAGLAHVRQCQEDPVRAYELNVTGTLNVLEACRRTGVTRLVFPSTAQVYGRPTQLPVEETAATVPISVYGATKLAAEILVQGYAAAFGFSCTIARIANVYGYGASSDSVPMVLLRQALEGETLRVKSLMPVRDFIYRDDVVEGLILLGQLTDPPGCRVYNLATGRGSSIRDLAQAVCRIAGLRGNLTALEGNNPESIPELVLSNEALFVRTSWRPIWSLEEGLRATLKEMEESGQ